MGTNPENRRVKRMCAGLLAHVDAGKTTLSEALLYRSGALKRLGRVDHGDAFLDTDALERERGITIFSKQARLELEDMEITLLDTPGHVDFSSEMERTLQVLDCAVLVISGTDGVQGHTETLWRLLARRHVPTFLFVNKMDLDGTDRAALLGELKARLSPNCVEFGGADHAAFLENAALCDEKALETYLETGSLGREEIAALAARRKLFPCYFGSALRLDGVDELLDGLRRYGNTPEFSTNFGARVYKIARDGQGSRLTYLKITGGRLRVKDLLTNRRAGLREDQIWEEKVDQIRLYSGAKFKTAETAEAGTVCAVTGLSRTRPGEGLGAEWGGEEALLEPVFSYRVELPPGADPHTALQKLGQLEEEDPTLRIVWNEQLGEIHIALMGEVQTEVLKRVILERFGLDVSFGAGSPVYRETIAAPCLGVGHYEPLRHYAEVHLLLEPGERGSGLQFASDCGEDQLDRGWQRLILTHLEEKQHLGVLTGSPITDMKITLIAGRGHLKHTEGGDFRQATYRAVRQGLMGASSVLLEPWYAFSLETPAECMGRAMSDLQRMGGEVRPPEQAGETAVLTGSAPASAMEGYAREVLSYTRGRGRLTCRLEGYAPCRNQAAAVAAVGYDPGRDLENPADSIFCAHGAGYTVRWDEVPAHAHVALGAARGEEERAAEEPEAPLRRERGSAGGPELDKELQAIYERTYGPVKRRDFQPTRRPEQEAWTERREIKPRDAGPEYLLVDGYNIIFAWDELKAAARESLDAARQLLMDLLSNYQGFRKCEVILVFDAYKVPGNPGEVSRYHNIHVVYTKEAETADAYIEKVTYQLAGRHRVRVATSDGVEQLIILGHGALRLSARTFKQEVEQVSGQISAVLEQNNRREKARPVAAAMERARKGPK